MGQAVRIVPHTIGDERVAALLQSSTPRVQQARAAGDGPASAALKYDAPPIHQARRSEPTRASNESFERRALLAISQATATMTSARSRSGAQSFQHTRKQRLNPTQWCCPQASRQTMAELRSQRRAGCSPTAVYASDMIVCRSGCPHRHIEHTWSWRGRLSRTAPRAGDIDNGARLAPAASEQVRFSRNSSCWQEATPASDG